MSQDNVTTMQTLTELWNAGDRSLTIIAAYFDPAIELASPLSSVAGEPYRGHAGIEEWMRDVDEQFSEWRLSIEDVRDLDDRVLLLGGVKGRGRASGIVFDFPSGAVAWFVGEKITRLAFYLDRNEALQTVGLED